MRTYYEAELARVEAATPPHKVNRRKRYLRERLARCKGRHTVQDWLDMLSFFGCCVICGRAGPIEKDHIVPLYQGGSDHISNLQPLCSRCNQGKSSVIDDFRQSYCFLKGLKMPTHWLGV